YREAGRLRPYGSIAGLALLEEAGYPGFTPAERDRLARHTTAAALRPRSARWGKAERVFELLLDETEQPRILQVKSAAALGAGRIVRIRSLDGELVEYGLVADTIARGARGSFNLARPGHVALLQPLTLPFEALETVVEPLVPVRVNVSTAGREVLQALLARLRPEITGVQRDADHGSSNAPRGLSRYDAARIADALLAMRGSTPDVTEVPGGEPRAFD